MMLRQCHLRKLLTSKITAAVPSSDCVLYFHRPETSTPQNTGLSKQQWLIVIVTPMDQTEYYKTIFGYGSLLASMSHV